MQQLILLINEKKYDIIFLSETHMTENIFENELKIEGYELINCVSHSRHTGGVAIYIRDNINYKIIYSFKSKFIWLVHVNIFVENETWSLGVFYRSPDQRSIVSNFINFFKDWCKEYMENELNCVIVGDGNINLLKEFYQARELKATICDEGLMQLVTQPTRITEYSKSLIDYVICKKDNVNVKYEIEHKNKISDHETIEINIAIASMEKGVSNDEGKIIKLLKYDKKKCLDILGLYNVSKLVEEENLNRCAASFENIIGEMLNKITISKEIKEKANSGWFTHRLKLLKAERNQAYLKAQYGVSYWQEYKRVRNLYKNEINKAKDNYVKTQIQQKSRDQKELWKSIKTLVLNEPKKENIKSIQFSNGIYEDRKVIAEKFNKFFVQSVEELNRSICNVLYSSKIKRVDSIFKFELVSDDVIMNILKKMNNKRDVIGLNSQIMIDLYDTIGPVLKKIINQSMECGHFPQSWKKSVVIPVSKVANSNKCENFRPVNMLPVYEKVLEKVICGQIEKYIYKNNILLKEQSGFRKGFSCETALNWITYEWRKCIDSGERIIAVFLDFKRAFETLDRDILVSKLDQYGIRGKELEWFKSYLSERFQQSKVIDELSDEYEVKLGVPQGSVAGVLLFLLYINDIGMVIKYCKIGLFADDTLIYISGNNIDEMQEKMNEDLQNLQEWLNMNKLKLNVSKTKCMALNLKHGNICIKLKDEVLEVVSKIKYLGVIIDNNLKFNEYVDEICSKISKKIGYLRRIRSKLSYSNALMLYNALVLPHFDYCATIIFSCSDTVKARLQLLQNKGMRMLLKCNYYTPIQNMLNALGWMNVRQRINYQVLVFIFKMKYNLFPEYLSNNLSYIQEVQPYELRRGDDFRLQQWKSSRGQNQLMYNGLRLFNNLPNDIKLERCLSKFRKLIIEKKNEYL